MNNYESYKETDIPWLGEIPSHWETKKIGKIFDIRKEKNSPVKTKEVLSLSSMYGVSLYSERKEKGGNKPKENLEAYNLCYPGDILVNSMNIVAGSVGISNYFGAISPVYYSLQNLSEKKYSKYYLEYLFRNYNFQRSLVGLGKGIQMSETEDGRLFTVRMRISWDTLKSQEFPTPPIEEQIQIANYLDWKINEIDRLILIEKEQIKELNHHKKLLISYEYSKQNKKRRIKTLLAEQLLYGINETGKENGNIRFVRITDIDTLGNLKNENILYLNKCDKKFLLIEDDILFARSGATVGKTYLQKKETSDMAFAGYLIRARINKNLINPKYVYYYFQSQEYEIWKESIFIQSTIQNISAERFANLEIPFADKLEQNIIIKRVKNINAKTEKILNLLNEKISNLQALKQSLIAEVVTGKIDVRNITIPQYEKVEIIFETDNIDETEVQDYGD